MTIAYMLVTGTYMLLGGAFYICFPLPKLCIEDVSFPLFVLVTDCRKGSLNQPEYS